MPAPSGPTPLRRGSRVVLTQAFYGYSAGTRGLVQRPPDTSGRVLVRIDGTGHGMFLTTDMLELQTDAG